MVRVVALVGLVALAACGSGEDPVLEGDQASEEAPAEGIALTIDGLGELVAGEPVSWRLTVTNATDEGVTLVFPSGQQGDVALVDGDGTEVYRWSDGMMFSQALVETPLEAGAEVTFELPGDLDVDPGTYLLTASVPSDPAPEPVTTEVTISG